MATCACAQWLAPLREWNDVKARIGSSVAQDLSPNLDLEAEGSWVMVFRCRVCGQRWAKEFPFSEMHGGGPPCLYALNTDDPTAWLGEGPGLPSRLRRDHEDQAFFERLGDERPEPRCAAQGCSRGAIAQSIFCRRHHFEMVMRRPCPFEC
jgi:hypothetical protein